MPLFIYEISVCLVLSFFFFRKGTLPEKLLPVFLVLLLSVELRCRWLYDRDRSPNLIYNFWFPVEFAYYGLLINSHILSRRTRNNFVKLAFGYIVFTAILYSFKKDMRIFSSLAYQVGFVVLLLISLYKLYEILNQEIIHNPLKNQVFWFIVGLMLVNLGGFFHFGLISYLNSNNKALSEALQQLNIYLTEVQYLCFILYFFFRWRWQKSHT